MTNGTHAVDLSGRVRTMQIIVAAITAGLAVFLAYALNTRAQGNQPGVQRTPIITYVASAGAASAIAARAFVPSLVLKSARRSIAQATPAAPPRAGPASVSDFGRAPASDVTRLCEAFQMKLIVGAATIEGEAFLAIIAYLIEGQWLSLILAVPLIAGVAMHFPTQSQVEHWIEDQLPLLEQERQSLG